MQVVVRAFEQIAQAEPAKRWELRDGMLREEPEMSVEHNVSAS